MVFNHSLSLFLRISLWISKVQYDSHKYIYLSLPFNPEQRQQETQRDVNSNLRSLELILDVHRKLLFNIFMTFFFFQNLSFKHFFLRFTPHVRNIFWATIYYSCFGGTSVPIVKATLPNILSGAFEHSKLS